MFKFRTHHFKWLMPVLMLVLSQSAAAQATRTWVSGVGDDANPCSRTAPCKTFAGAISKTAAGGEINAIDSGGFGAVTITKSIVIDGAGVMASILSSGTTGVIVNAGVNDVVTIRNVSINGSTTGLNGIRYLQGKELHVEGVVLENFTQKGIDVSTSTGNGNGALFVRDTIIRNASNSVNGGAIQIKPIAPSTVDASLDNVRMDSNKFGIRVEDNAKATVRNSVVSNSIGNGYLAVSASAAAEIFIENSIADGNNAAAIFTSGNAAIARISNVSIHNNAAGLSPQPGSQIISFGNNRNGNTLSPGAPTSTVVQQ